MNLSKDNIIGVWHLKSFTNINKDGTETSWDGQLRGHLIYTKENIVSVSMNRFRNFANGEADHKCSFYTGIYKILDAETIEHTIEAAPDPERIGSCHKRSIRLKAGVLKLRGTGLTGEVALIWERAK